MKKYLFIILSVSIAGSAMAQSTYYWVGGTNSLFNTTTNWNTALDGSGSSRGSNSNAADILVFDGTNIGGAVPTTGQATVAVNGTITCAQIKLINNADIVWIRSSTGTGTINISGDGSPAEDFIIESGAKLSFLSTVGSVRVAMVATTTGRCNGTLIMNTPLQARFDNTTSGTPGSFLFKNGSSFSTNITASSASYAFGNSSQSSNGWVKFEAGSEIFYLGGYSPHGSGTNFSSIDIQPGNIWHHRASNAGAGGNFFNRQSYGDIIVENNATLTATGSVYRIGNLTVNSGCTFIPHTSGQTAVTGNLIVNGDYLSPAAGTNNLVLAGNSPQTISGSGTMNLGGFTISDKADVTLNKNIMVEDEVEVFGKINFNNYQLTGTATFKAAGVEAGIAGTGNLVFGNYFISGNSAYSSSSIGKTITGTGIAPNTAIVSFSTTSDSMYISQPLTASGSSVALMTSNDGATLATSHPNGFDITSGSVIISGNKTYGDSINYIINAATSAPFGISTGSSGNMILVGFAEINAPVTVNTGLKIHDHLTLNGKLTLRPLDLLHIANNVVINGTFSASSYIATDYNGANGDQSILQVDGLASVTTLPIGTINYYLPVGITPTSSSDFTVAVFEGITTNGMVTGTPLTPTQKQTVVDAVWNINRISGSGDAVLELNWDAALEGSTFTTLPDTDIGMIKNNGSSWDLPIGTGNNTSNIVTATFNSFGAFSIGAVPQTAPFVFNPLPVKTYGDPDFNGGATSLNTTQPIIYSSNNPAVATIVSGNIHITGAGTADINASQASDGFYPAANVTQTLTVDKAPLIIKADDKLKFEGQPNPTLTATYTGFVLGETPTALLTPAVITTTAVTASPPGNYPITVSGATSNNYDITFQSGVLTVQPKQNQTITFNALPTKTYGNTDFSAGATSTNNTIPITYASSNIAVATVNSSGIIHITGAGTTTITASQAGNAGYFPAADVARVLTVNKANLTIRVVDTSKVQGTANPVFTITYTGFVLGEIATNLLTQPTPVTSATVNSSPGYYNVTPEGATSNNYNINNVSGRLTIFPAAGTDKQYLVAFYNTSGSLTVRVFSPEPVIGDIMVYDLSGKPIAKRNLFMPSGFIQTDFPVPTVSSGIYVVTVRGNGVDLKKLVRIIK